MAVDKTMIRQITGYEDIQVRYAPVTYEPTNSFPHPTQTAPAVRIPEDVVAMPVTEPVPEDCGFIPKFYTPGQVSEITHASVNAIRRWALRPENNLAYTADGRRILIEARDFNEFIERNKVRR